MTTDYSQLLIDVQKKSNILITNVRDIKFLKEEIDSYKNLKIGYNTLRRLFGFLKHTETSVGTLNTLAEYLDCKSYSNYINRKLNFDEWYFQQKLLLIQESNEFNNDEIDAINFGLSYRKNIVYVAYLIANLIQRNNIEALHKIFKKIQLNNFLDSDLLKFATIITRAFYKKNETDSIAIYKSLINYESFKNSVPLMYIDYSNLNGIYFKVLGLIEKQSTITSDLLFVSLMRFYKEFYTGSLPVNENIKTPENFSKFHSVLKGRYFAYKIMASKAVESSLKQIIFKECKVNNVNLFVEEILPALLIKEEYKILSELSEKFYEEIFESKGWSDRTTNSIFLIALANISLYTNNSKVAKRNLELIDFEKIELSYYDYISMFYYHTLIKISHLENDLKVNTEAFFNLEKIVLKTGFVRFLLVTQPYILD